MRLCQINNSLGTLYGQIDRRDMSVKYKTAALQTARIYNDEAANLLIDPEHFI
jgi:hypothetical protein